MGLDLRALTEAAAKIVAMEPSKVPDGVFWKVYGDWVEACEPTVVLALLNRLEAAEAAVARVEALAELWDRPGMVGIAPRLRAALTKDGR